MKRRQLGKDGPEVGAIGFGCMSFAGFFGPADDDTSMACLEAALAAGIDFWDTANVYGMGRSETVIGRFLAASGADVTLATKASIVRGPPRGFDNSADHLRSELEASLKRLGRDSVELFYIHRREQERPVEEVAETLAGFIEEGLIGGYGLSEVAPSTLRRAHAVHPCRAVQNEYSLWTRQPELGLIQTCAELGVAFVPFSPLARGFFSEASIAPSDMADGDFRVRIPRFTEPDYGLNVKAFAPFRAFCAERGWTVAAAAIAWVLDQGPHMLPIPGTRTAEHLGEWAEADQIVFSQEDRDRIDAILPVGWAFGDRYSDAQAVGPERYS
jgi:aryl-alcohol dehydrogenase-like predicted oxidoreductase